MDRDEASRAHEPIAQIRRALLARGVKLEIDGETATFEVDDQHLERDAHWLPATTSTSTFRRARGRGTSAVYFAERITSALAREIRDSGGWYADAGGNVYLRAPGLLVDVIGRAPVVERATSASGTTPHNLMSVARAQVVFTVLTWPQLLTRSLREIAHVAGVSTAAAHTALKLLEEERYLTHSRLLARRDELIDLWASAFPLGLARSTEQGRYRGEPDPAAWPALGHRVYVSGEFAADDLSGPDLVLYVPEVDSRAVIRSRWQRPETNSDANIIVRTTFWTEPDRWDEGEPGVSKAPSLLIYGDLLASNDPRQREIAAAMRRDL